MIDGKLEGTDGNERLENYKSPEESSKEIKAKNYETTKNFLLRDKASDREVSGKNGARNQILLTPENLKGSRDEKSKSKSDEGTDKAADTKGHDTDGTDTPKSTNDSKMKGDAKEVADSHKPERMSADEKIMDSQKAVERSKWDVEDAQGLDTKFQQAFDETKSSARTLELKSIRNQNNHAIEHLSSRRQSLETGLSGYEEKRSEIPAAPDNPQYRYLTDKVNEYRDALHEVDGQIDKLKENNKRIDAEVGAEKSEKKSAADTVRDFIEKFRRK